LSRAKERENEKIGKFSEQVAFEIALQGETVYKISGKITGSRKEAIANGVNRFQNAGGDGKSRGNVELAAIGVAD
jgi:hypothetical protein